MKEVAVLLVSLCLCGCSPQKTLAKRLESADGVVVTNTMLKSGCLVRTDEIQKIIRCVAAARRDRSKHPALFDGEIRFFSGTNHLSSIRFQDRLLLCGEYQYSDESGLLMRLYECLTTNAEDKAVRQ